MPNGSLPARVAWIEIVSSVNAAALWKSLPARVAWIEIFKAMSNRSHTTSLPARVAWIEMCTEIVSILENLGRYPRG